MSTVEAGPRHPLVAGGDARAGEPPTTRIRPETGWAALDLGELWAARELLLFFVWRDVKLRYAQTVIGASWAVVQPFLTMVVFTLFFGRLVGVPSDGAPYPLFSLAALIPWTFFATGVARSAGSLVSQQSLLTKIYFPRPILPVASVLAGGLDVAIALAVLLAMLLLYGVAPAATAIWVVPLLVLCFVAALGAGLWLAALNVRFRDVQQAVPFLLQLWLFASPVAYSDSQLGDPWRTLYALNPMVAVIKGFRWALLGTEPPGASVLLASSLVAVASLVGGAYFFRWMERSFADVV
jgi:lipopolysaccharide transport system permease protein